VALINGRIASSITVSLIELVPKYQVVCVGAVTILWTITFAFPNFPDTISTIRTDICPAGHAVIIAVAIVYVNGRYRAESFTAFGNQHVFARLFAGKLTAREIAVKISRPTSYSIRFAATVIVPCITPVAVGENTITVFVFIA
jgi:hypothetical protein